MQEALTQASNQNPGTDNADVKKVIGILGDVVHSLTEEVRQGEARRDASLSSRCLAVMGMHLGVTSVAADDDGARQRIINELCLKQADQYRLRLLQLENEIRLLQVDLHEIKSLLET